MKTHGGIPESEQKQLDTLNQKYGCGPVAFYGTDNALYERHLLFDNVMSL